MTMLLTLTSLKMRVYQIFSITITVKKNMINMILFFKAKIKDELENILSKNVYDESYVFFD